MAGIVDPDINALEVMKGQREDTINFLRVANVAGEGYGAIGITNACTGGFGAGGVA